MTMGFFSGALLGGCIALVALLVAYMALMYSLNFYFPEGRKLYMEEFMGLEEVQALHGAYPAAGPGGSSGRVTYAAVADDRSLVVDLEIRHKRHSFEVTGMILSCRGIDGHLVWSVDDDILHHIDRRRCF